MDYTLINFSGYYQRAELRSMICSNCKERIALTNPFVSYIYFGVPTGKNIQDIMNKARKFKIQVKCPNCEASTIKQTAIWAKPTLE